MLTHVSQRTWRGRGLWAIGGSRHPAMSLSTFETLRQLGCSRGQLNHLLARRRIPPPREDRSGRYCWSSADIERAARALPTIRRGRPVLHGPHNELEWRD